MGLEKIIGSSKASLILLHPSSLPDPEGKTYGIGELGSEAIRFIDFLEDSGILTWQVLPLGHTGYGNSPYQTFSRFAGSPYLISVENLLEKGDVSQEQHDHYMKINELNHKSNADFQWLFKNKLGEEGNSEAVLRQAFRRFIQNKGERFECFERFCEKKSFWLVDYAEFMALKELNNHKHWQEWDDKFKNINNWRAERKRFLKENSKLYESIIFYKYLQFIFFEQWTSIKQHAVKKGRKIIGDIPFYVGYDSADTWANREIFEFSTEGVPLYVAGVPPDYFSATGQLWGNPLYNWNNPKTFSWWADTAEHILGMVDILRIDHFRAVDSFWKVPYEVAVNEKTAIRGMWSKGPGANLLNNIKKRILENGMIKEDGQLPFIAEDLGFLDPLYARKEDYPLDTPLEGRFDIDDSFKNMILSKSSELGAALNQLTGEYSTRKGVDALLQEFDLPYMLVLQFGLEGEFKSKPENVPANCVYYSGTHDNDTFKGWYESSDKATIDEFLSKVEIFQKTKSLTSGVLGLLCGSNANIIGVPLQDLLGLGSEARMNLPGNMKEGGWWNWRATRPQLNYLEISSMLSRILKKYGRLY